jgi:hypothetical protein
MLAFKATASDRTERLRQTPDVLAVTIAYLSSGSYVQLGYEVLFPFWRPDIAVSG